MKIRLYAFDDMKGEIRDVPENTTPEFKIVLRQPMSVVVGYSGENIGEIPPLNTICTFEWTGKYEGFTDAKVYRLSKIEKM